MSTIEEAIARGAFAEAAALALTAWRGEPRSEMADLLDVLTSRVTSAARQLPARAPKPEYQKAWMALAKTFEPNAVAWLVDGLTRSVPEGNTSLLRPHYMRTRIKAYLARVEMLARFPKDPRISARLVAVLQASPWSAMDREGALDVYGSTIELLGEINDQRSIAALNELLAHPTAKRASIRELYAELLPGIVKLLQSAPAPKPQAPDARVVALLTQLGAARSSSPSTTATTATAHRNEEALLAMVLANPDDREARQVYADALLDRGDPRGELMAIQLKAKQTPQDQKRVRSIQLKYDRGWLGDLARVLRMRVYRDGMLEEAELLQAAVADDDTWQRISRDERLATIRTLRKGSANETLYRQLVFSPAMRGLREVTVPSRDMLTAICESPRPLPFTHLIIERPMRPRALEQLDTKALPHLKRLTIAVEPDRVASVLTQLTLLQRRFVEIAIDPRGWWAYSRTGPKAARLAVYNRKVLQRQARKLAPTHVTLPEM